MNFLDFTLVFVVCLIWASQFVMSKIIVADLMVPPFFFTAIRFSLVLLATVPWFLPLPRSWRWLAVAGFFLGSGGFGAFTLALKTVSPSAAAIVYQLNIPMTAILSVVLLKEVIAPTRVAGIGLTILGAVLVMWDPNALTFSPGLLLVALSALLFSIGTVLIKRQVALPVLQFQSWVGAASVAPIALLSAGYETGQWESLGRGGWPLIFAIVYSAVVVTLVGHSLYYRLSLRNDASLLASLMVMNPILTVLMSIFVTGDQITGLMVAGIVVACSGVVLCTMRRRVRSAIPPDASAAG